MDQSTYFEDNCQRTDLDNFEKSTFTNQSKDKLIERLLFYIDLERKGHIYYENKPHNTSTLRELLCNSTNMSEEKLNELLNCGFTLDSTGQSRSLVKYNRQKYILRLSTQLSTKYIRDHNGAKCPRMKKSKTTTDLLNCKSGHTNCYPNKYIELVNEFLEKYPINSWHIDTSKKMLDDNFTYDASVEKWVCNNCDKKYVKASRTSHLRKCNLLVG